MIPYKPKEMGPASCLPNRETTPLAQAKPDSLHANIAITVIDSVWVKPAYSTPFGGDEQITMVPQYVKSLKSNSSYIAFTASTKKAYCTNMTMDYGISYASHDHAYDIQFNGTLLNAPDCGISRSILTAHNNFSSYLPAVFNGTYPLHIFFNGKNRDGSIDVTATTITFNWDDASGVVIKPKQMMLLNMLF